MSNKFGVIVGNRGFFADELARSGRQELLEVMNSLGLEAITLSENQGVSGSVQSRDDAKVCAQLFKEHKDELVGVIVSLPNFGDEKAVADVIRASGLDVPVLVHAFPDKLEALDYAHRRDSFCGKISVCNSLKQYGIRFSLTSQHTMDPTSDAFKADLAHFAGVCRVVHRLRSARIGVIGPRPNDFNTVRFSEKLLERQGISVESIGLIDILNGIAALADSDTAVQAARERIAKYMDSSRIPDEVMTKLAKLLLVTEQWVKDNDYDAIAIQCWSSLQETFGVNPCVIMSMLSQSDLPAACEADAAGAISMLALQAASGRPSALVDWNNNYADDPNKVVLFHCGNYAKAFYEDAFISYADILGSTLGNDKTYGAIAGRIKSGPITFARISTDDFTGKICAYVADGQMTNDHLDTFGSWGVANISNLNGLMQHICRQGFEHHVAISLSQTAPILEEAFNNYLDWSVYRHEA